VPPSLPGGPAPRGRRRACGAVLLLLVLAPAGCAPASPVTDGPPLVVVSIFPIADLVAGVGGDAVRVETLLPPRASPSTWEATPAQIRALSSAAGYVTIGGGLDGWLEDLADDTPGLRRLRLTDGMVLRREAQGAGESETGDPHVWLDPVLVRDVLLPKISAFLEAIAPGRSGDIGRREAAWADTLTRLDAEVRATLARAPRRAFVSTHDAWGYFAARYGLDPLGSIYASPGHEPSARGLAQLVEVARKAGVRVVLAEPQLAETAGRALAAELRARVLVADPLGGRGIPGRDGYTALLRTDARAFAEALGAS
jgi:zinc transport system substrate-binding protein